MELGRVERILLLLFYEWVNWELDSGSGIYSLLRGGVRIILWFFMIFNYLWYLFFGKERNYV